MLKESDSSDVAKKQYNLRKKAKVLKHGSRGSSVASEDLEGLMEALNVDVDLACGIVEDKLK